MPSQRYRLRGMSRRKAASDCMNVVMNASSAYPCLTARSNSSAFSSICSCYITGLVRLTISRYSSVTVILSGLSIITTILLTSIYHFLLSSSILSIALREISLFRSLYSSTVRFLSLPSSGRIPSSAKTSSELRVLPCSASF